MKKALTVAKKTFTRRRRTFGNKNSHAAFVKSFKKHTKKHLQYTAKTGKGNTKKPMFLRYAKTRNVNGKRAYTIRNQHAATAKTRYKKAIS